MELFCSFANPLHRNPVLTRSWPGPDPVLTRSLAHDLYMKTQPCPDIPALMYAMSAQQPADDYQITESPQLHMYFRLEKYHKLCIGNIPPSMQCQM